MSDARCVSIQWCTDLVENFDLIDNLRKLQQPIWGCLGLQKLDSVENFNLVKKFVVTNFSTKSVLQCIYTLTRLPLAVVYAE